jgi:Cu/Ag efflux pump CusA
MVQEKYILGTIWKRMEWICEQRALQDWYVKFALQTVPGAEVASLGGFENNINWFRSLKNAVP